ncbi:MAG: aspartate aminotransferase family protein [Candidatus Rokuibacteriota bacterium]
MPTPPIHVPDPEDLAGLQLAAREYLFVGMWNAEQLAAEGGPIVPVASKGINFRDLAGNEFIDAIGGMYFRNVGYGRDEIAAAVARQLEQVSMGVYAAAAPATIRLAARLAQLAPGDLSRTFFTTGGSEANETSLKLAQAYHVRQGARGRFKVISRRGSYHGATYGTQWLGGHPGFPRTDYQPMPAHVAHIGQPNPYRCEYGGRTPEECAELCAWALEEAILFHGPESVSAFIGEPVSQPLGGVVPGPGYWPRVREICDRYGVLLIFDEVITGFGRLGAWFGADYFGVTPDIMSFAKGITSGYFPYGGSIATRRVADAFLGGADRTFKHMFTYTGHPAGAAAGQVNQDIIEREGLVDNARARGEQLRERLAETMARHPIVGDARGVGLLQGLELVRDRRTKEHFPAEAGLGARLTESLRKRGVWLRVPAFVLPIAPPLVISTQEIDHLSDVVDAALGEVERELGLSPR